MKLNKNYIRKINLNIISLQKIIKKILKNNIKVKNQKY